MAAANLQACYLRRQLRWERVFQDRENPRGVRSGRSASLVPISTRHDPTQRMALPHCYNWWFSFVSFVVVVGDTLPRVSKATVCRSLQRVIGLIHLLSRRLNQHVNFPQTDELRDRAKRKFYAIAGIFLKLIMICWEAHWGGLNQRTKAPYKCASCANHYTTETSFISIEILWFYLVFFFFFSFCFLQRHCRW